MIRWIKWRRKLLKQSLKLTEKYPNLSFLPQNIKDIVNCESWRESFNDGMSPMEAIDEELCAAARDS